MRAVVVSFDHLHLGSIGCYGNDWIETPHLDRLATEAVVFDQHFGADFARPAADPGWWSGRFPFDAVQSDADRRHWLTDRLREAGVATHLISESNLADEVTVAPTFDSVVAVSVDDDGEVSESQAGFARLVTAAIPHLVANNQPELLWIKSRGVAAPWVPPREFVDLYFDEFGIADTQPDAELDEDDQEEDSGGDDEIDVPDEAVLSRRRPVPQPAPSAEPEVLSSEEVDIQYARALYAGYVTYLDRWLGKLLSQIDQSPQRDETLVIIVAAAGESLGEHGVLGTEETQLCEERIHTPLIVRMPQSNQSGTRRASIVQTVDIAATLVDWFGLVCPESSIDGQSLLPLIRNERQTLREAAWLGIGGQLAALRTRDYFYARGASDASGQSIPAGRLFEKPGDRWDMVNVASQFAAVVADLESMLASRRPSE